MSSDTSPIWRYVDLARFALLLSRGLFFSRADSFGDRWEGSWGGADLAAFRKAHERLSREELERAWEVVNGERLAALRAVGVSCWHWSLHESAALWELYLPKGLGVAIQSSTSRLLDACTAAGRPVQIVAVRYEGYDDLSTRTDVVSLLQHKRPEFSYEQEVRVLLSFHGAELSAMDTMRLTLNDRDSRFIAPGPPQPLIRSYGGWSSNDPTIDERTAPDGAHISTDAKLLIERIVLPPGVSYPMRRAVLDVALAFGLERHVVRESDVDRAPFSSVKVIDPPVKFSLADA